MRKNIPYKVNIISNPKKEKKKTLNSLGARYNLTDNRYRRIVITIDLSKRGWIINISDGTFHIKLITINDIMVE